MEKPKLLGQPSICTSVLLPKRQFRTLTKSTVARYCAPYRKGSKRQRQHPCLQGASNLVGTDLQRADYKTLQ